MKKFFVIAFLASLIPFSPAKANPVAEQCFNSLIQREEQRPDSAELLFSVNHGDSQYHVILQSSDIPRVPSARVYLKTDNQGGCSEVLSYLVDSFPSEQVYKEKLGAEVFAKIRQKAQSLK